MSDVKEEKWFLLCSDESGLRQCATAPVEYKENGKPHLPRVNVKEALNVLAVIAMDNPLDEDRLIKKGSKVWVNPHRSESPHTYTV